ncbi:MAG: class I SAM-dependent methyltransferase [Aeromicrobium sp.]
MARDDRGEGLRRSWALFSAFRVEQSDPDRFYGMLADDSVALIERHESCAGALVLDLGAGPSQFAERFRSAGAHYIALDHDETVESVARDGVVADAQRMPIRSGSVDIAFTSNLIEHVERPVDVADEMVRVTRPGGLIVISYTNWLSPWGGHETSPFHWVSGAYAIRRYERRNGHLPKNRLGINLFDVSVAWGMEWAGQASDVVVLEARPRYLPRWCRFIVHVPVLREFLSWNLLLILRRR